LFQLTRTTPKYTFPKEVIAILGMAFLVCFPLFRTARRYPPQLAGLPTTHLQATSELTWTSRANLDRQSALQDHFAKLCLPQATYTVGRFKRIQGHAPHQSTSGLDKMWSHHARVVSELLGVDGISTSPFLGVESESPCSRGWPPGTIGVKSKPASRLDEEVVVVEVRLYDRYCT
jgi:hypothetical protein